MEMVLTFHTTRAAVNGEQALEESGLPVKTMALPSSLGAGCGLCLRLESKDLEKALVFLAKINVEPAGIYCRSQRGGIYCYTPHLMAGENL